MGVRQRSSKRQALLVAIGGGVLAVVLAAADKKNTGLDYIERQNPGEGTLEQEYILDAEGVLKDYSWIVKAQERKLTQEERKKTFQKAQKELEERILGENKSLEKINHDLYLPDTLQGGVVKVKYGFSDYKIFYPDGTIRELPRETAVVIISAEMECQKETNIYEFAVQAVPIEKSAKELFIKKIAAELEMENEKAGKEKLVLPKKVDGVELSWREKTENRSLIVGILGIVATGCIAASEKEKKKKLQKEREKQLQRDYPGILAKLILLMGAGMNTATAWKQIGRSYYRQREEGLVSVKPAYEELLTAVYEMQEGIGEVQAYKNFGERCKVIEYRRLSAILVQNVRKGSAQIYKILEEEKTEAYEKQKARVRTAGEEAGTKLLLPMVLMLLVVLVIIMVPAGMSMNL